MPRACCLLVPLVALLTAAPVAAQKREVPAAQAASAGEHAAYEKWLADYAVGKVLLVKDSRVDEEADRRFRQLFAEVAKGGGLAAAKLLWRAAVIELPIDMNKHDRLDARLGVVRGAAKKLIAGLADPAIDAWLVEEATRKGGKAGDLQRSTAIELIGLRERPESAALLVDRLKTFAIPERIDAILALERTGSLDTLPVLLPLLREAEPNVRIAVVQSVTGLLGPYTDETKAENLAGGGEGAKLLPAVLEELRKVMARDEVWQVRVAICDGLVRLRTPKAIPLLIQGLERELGLGKWSNQMVAIAYHEALEQMTGQDLPENSPSLWKEFWQKEGGTFRFTPEAKDRPRGEGAAKAASAPGYAKYFNLDIKSKRLLFIIDFSGSMAEKVNLQARYAGGTQHVKYELVKKELEKVIRSLPRDAVCNVVFFNDSVSVWRQGKDGRPELVPMGDDNKSDLLQYVWETAPGGSTNLYGALEKALSMGDRGVYDKYYNTAYDSIFLLSDGAPSSGEIVEPAQILEAVRRANKLRRLRIHTVVFGDAMNNLRFMRDLATENGGQFMHVQ